MSLIMVSLLAGMSIAMDIKGKTGVGLRADGFSVRHFVNNSFGFDIGANYYNSTESGLTDSNNYNYSIGGFWAKEVFKDILLEAGATLQGWNGYNAIKDLNYNGFGINPFIGAECFINEHFSLDGKVFIAAYGSQMEGTDRTTDTNVLNGNLGAHIYF
jgi:hypothetical protein